MCDTHTGFFMTDLTPLLLSWACCVLRLGRSHVQRIGIGCSSSAWPSAVAVAASRCVCACQPAVAWQTCAYWLVLPPVLHASNPTPTSCCTRDGLSQNPILTSMLMYVAGSPGMQTGQCCTVVQCVNLWWFENRAEPIKVAGSCRRANFVAAIPFFSVAVPQHCQHVAQLSTWALLVTNVLDAYNQRVMAVA